MNTQKRSIFVAHRGLQPENTLWALKQAYAQGFMAAECDVWVSRDNHVVVCHDETLKRTAVSQNHFLDHPISSLSLEQLNQVLVGDTQHNQPVPLLKEVLAIVPDHKQLLVEIKFQDLSMLKHFISCVEGYLDKIIAISFYPQLLAELKKQLPNCKIMLLTTAKQYREETVIVNDRQSFLNALAFIKKMDLDGLGFEYSEFIDHCGIQEKSPASEDLGTPFCKGGTREVGCVCKGGAGEVGCVCKGGAGEVGCVCKGGAGEVGCVCKGGAGEVVSVFKGEVRQTNFTVPPLQKGEGELCEPGGFFADHLLTQLWYSEKNPEKVQAIITAALNAGIGFINVDTAIPEFPRSRG